MAPPEGATDFLSLALPVPRPHVLGARITRMNRMTEWAFERKRGPWDPF